VQETSAVRGGAVVRLGLLAGTIPTDRLGTLLSAVKAQRDQTDDPRLEQILDEIELRAAVELAKLGQFG